MIEKLMTSIQQFGQRMYNWHSSTDYNVQSYFNFIDSNNKAEVLAEIEEECLNLIIDRRAKASLKKEKAQWKFIEHTSSQPCIHYFSDENALDAYLASREDIDTWHIEDKSTNKSKSYYKMWSNLLGAFEVYQTEKQLNQAVFSNLNAWCVEEATPQGIQKRYVINQSGWFKQNYLYFDEVEKFKLALIDQIVQRKNFLHWKKLSIATILTTASVVSSRVNWLRNTNDKQYQDDYSVNANNFNLMSWGAGVGAEWINVAPSLVLMATSQR